MIYVSIDIETSGLDHTKHSVLSIGAIIEDTEKKLPFLKCPRFNAIILQNEIILVLFAIKTFICVEQIPAFEFGVENVLVLFLEMYLLIICWIMICCVIQRKYIACV